PNIAQPSVQGVTATRSQFTFAGRLETSKGIWDVLEAAKILQNSGDSPKITVIGDGAESADLRKYAAENLLENVRFIGKSDTQTVLGEYAQSYAVLAPSRWPEPFGRFIQEAATAGTGVITCRVGGIPEAIIHEENGLFVPPGNPE